MTTTSRKLALVVFLLAICSPIATFVLMISVVVVLASIWGPEMVNQHQAAVIFAAAGTTCVIAALIGGIAMKRRNVEPAESTKTHMLNIGVGLGVGAIVFVCAVVGYIVIRLSIP